MSLEMNINQEGSATLTDLTEFILEINNSLETSAQVNANQAFNLGCTVGLVPALLFFFVMIYFVGFSVIVIFVASLLTVLMLIAFANITALIAKNRTIDKTFDNNVKLSIDEFLENQNITKVEFERTSVETLAPGSPLLKYISYPPEKPEI